MSDSAHKNFGVIEGTAVETGRTELSGPENTTYRGVARVEAVNKAKIDAEQQYAFQQQARRMASMIWGGKDADLALPGL